MKRAVWPEGSANNSQARGDHWQQVGPQACEQKGYPRCRPGTGYREDHRARRPNCPALAGEPPLRCIQGLSTEVSVYAHGCAKDPGPHDDLPEIIRCQPGKP